MEKRRVRGTTPLVSWRDLVDCSGNQTSERRWIWIIIRAPCRPSLDMCAGSAPVTLCRTTTLRRYLELYPFHLTDSELIRTDLASVQSLENHVTALYRGDAAMSR